LWNSLVVAAFASAATLAVAVPASYVLSRDRFRGRRPLLAALLVVPDGVAGDPAGPIYGIIERLGLIDTRAG
jgi:ABC-type maltose transport system permease subunit